ncbi:MAG TPA: hypothetical protein VLI04_21440 [Nocardioidaceae bacterium]|nr:hypothetical protein [Nocardioidaceae bacterium]
MSRLRSLPVVLAALLVVLLATAAVLWLRDRRDVDSGMVAVATEEARNFFSLDYRTADEDVDRVLALATGDFAEQYAAKRDEVVAGVEKAKLVVTASVPEEGTAVEYAAEDSGQVLVAVDVSSRSTSGAEDVRYRTRIVLTKVDGRWLVSDLEQVG